MKQTRQPVRAIKQSIYLDVYGYCTPQVGAYPWLQEVDKAEKYPQGQTL